MKMSIRELDDVVVVTFDGNIVQEYVSVFRSRLDDFIIGNKVKIVLNLKEANYMSSMCLAVIIDAKNKAAVKGGDIKIACANRVITNLIEITNLNRKIRLYDSIEAAVASFTEPVALAE